MVPLCYSTLSSVPQFHGWKSIKQKSHKLAIVGCAACLLRALDQQLKISAPFRQALKNREGRRTTPASERGYPFPRRHSCNWRVRARLQGAPTRLQHNHSPESRGLTSLEARWHGGIRDFACVATPRPPEELRTPEMNIVSSRRRAGVAGSTGPTQFVGVPCGAYCLRMHQERI